MRSSDLAEVSVLHLLAPDEVGGKEAIVSGLVLGARGSRVEAHVAAVLPAGGREHPFVTPLRDAGMDVVAVEVPRRGYLREQREVARLCHRLRPDVVHTHGYRADVVDAPVARSLGIPVVSTAHGFTGGGARNRFYQWLERRAWRRFQAVVAVSRPLLDDLLESGVPRDRLHYIQNAWRPSELPLDRGAASRTLGIAPRGFRVGWIGRLSAEKGPDVLVEALRELRDFPVTVSFVGHGPLRRTLDARTADLGLRDRVQWHGLVPRAGRLLRAFQVFALTSRTEGTPVALLEAMAAQVPIIATRVGGVPDVVSTKEALLVPPDDAHAVAAALRDVFEHPAAARERSRAARERLERAFGIGAWLRRYETVYRGVCRRAAAGPS